MLIAANALFLLASAIYVPTLTLYGAELFEAANRATGLSRAWACNRLGAVLAPLVLLPLLRNEGTIALVATIAATLAASVGLLFASPRGRERQPVM